MSAPRLQPVRVRIAGCPLDVFSFAQAVNELGLRVEQRRRTHVIFVNVFKIAEYHSNPRLQEVMERADLLLPDGVPVLWASALLGTPLPERVAGTDLMQALLELSALRNYRVFLLGGEENVITRTVETLRGRYPTLQIAGYRNGYFSDADADSVIETINASNADLLFIGMSTPKKELWADACLSRLTVPVCQGVGGSFDVIAGLTRRAPIWMQRSGLEWSYRLMQEPRRLWRRYLGSGAKVASLLCHQLLAVWKTRVVNLLKSPATS
jgi:N-acetylglucosaminyldiphosphoundecaprenol N-acetyl-beta-D-mannosaminyltransferase